MFFCYNNRYVGLFSGGQILRKKRSLVATLTFRSAAKMSGKGEAVTDFGETRIFKLKKEMMSAMEQLAEQIGEEDRAQLIEESKNVFRMNNQMIRSISTNRVVLRKFAYFFLAVAAPVLLATVYFSLRTAK